MLSILYLFVTNPIHFEGYAQEVQAFGGSGFIVRSVYPSAIYRLSRDLSQIENVPVSSKEVERVLAPWNDQAIYTVSNGVLFRHKPGGTRKTEIRLPWKVVDPKDVAVGKGGLIADTVETSSGTSVIQVFNENRNSLLKIRLPFFVQHLRISPDGRYIAASRRDSKVAGSLYLIDLRTKRYRSVLPSGDICVYPNFSSDSRKVVCVRRAYRDVIWVVPVSSGKPLRFAESQREIYWPVVTPRGILFVADLQDLVILSSGGSETLILKGGSKMLSHPRERSAAMEHD